MPWHQAWPSTARLYVQFVNGFDFYVTAKITNASGTTSVEIPANGRIGADLAGENTIELRPPNGTAMERQQYTFATRDKRKKRCQEYVNVLGAAAIIKEEIAYGIDINSAGTLLSGNRQVKVCPQWGFETKQPPDNVRVKGRNNYSTTEKWLHYIGEGDWRTSIESLLAKPPNPADQDRIMAWNLAVAVSKDDPNNPRLAALGPQCKAACHKIVDYFTTGPLAGNAEKRLA